MTYLQQSLGKRAARVKFWADALGLVGVMRGSPEAISKARCLVLCGPDCGDVSTLLGWGIHPNNIVACDLNREYVTRAKQQYPGIRAFCCDVRDAVGMGWADVIFLDFCGNVSETLIATTASVIELCAASTSVVGIGYMRGREARSVTTSLRKLHDTCVELKRKHKFRGNPHSIESNDFRRYMLVNGVNERLPDRLQWDPHYQYDYMGSRVPMSYVVGEIGVRKVSRMARWFVGMTHHERIAIKPREYVEEVLAAASLGGSEYASLLYNEPRGRVAAWMAVRTARERKQAAAE